MLSSITGRHGQGLQYREISMIFRRDFGIGRHPTRNLTAKQFSPDFAKSRQNVGEISGKW